MLKPTCQLNLILVTSRCILGSDCMIQKALLVKTTLSLLEDHIKTP